MRGTNSEFVPLKTDRPSVSLIPLLSPGQRGPGRSDKDQGGAAHGDDGAPSSSTSSHVRPPGRQQRQRGEHQHAQRRPADRRHQRPPQRGGPPHWGREERARPEAAEGEGRKFTLLSVLYREKWMSEGGSNGYFSPSFKNLKTLSAQPLFYKISPYTWEGKNGHARPEGGDEVKHQRRKFFSFKDTNNSSWLFLVIWHLFSLAKLSC